MAGGSNTTALGTEEGRADLEGISDRRGPPTGSEGAGSSEVSMGTVFGLEWRLFSPEGARLLACAAPAGV